MSEEKDSLKNPEGTTAIVVKATLRVIGTT